MRLLRAFTTILSLTVISIVEIQADVKELPQDKARMQVLRKAKLDSALKLTVKEFEKHGNTKAAWSKTALEGLRLRAEYMAMPSISISFPWTNDEESKSLKLLKKAVDEGCDDPTVIFYSFHPITNDQAKLKKYCETYRDLCKVFETKKYSAERIMICYWWATSTMIIYNSLFPDNKDNFVPQPFFMSYLAAFKKVASQKTEESDLFLWNHVNSYRRHNAPQLLRFYEGTKAMLEQAKVSEWLLHAHEGLYHCETAFAIRGKEFASETAPENLKTFEEHCQKAYDALKKASEADPKRPGPARKIITASLGLSMSDDEVYQWLIRALEADPDDYLAANGVILKFHPKWGGNEEKSKVLKELLLKTGNHHGALPMLACDLFNGRQDLLQNKITPYIRTIEMRKFQSEALLPLLKNRPDCVWGNVLNAMLYVGFGNIEDAKKAIDRVDKSNDHMKTPVNIEKFRQTIEEAFKKKQGLDKQGGVNPSH